MESKFKYYKKILNSFLSKYKIKKIYFHFFLLLVVLFPFCKNNKFQWLTTFFSVFSIMSNDSIQAMGTYLASHQKEKWYKLFFMFGTVFIISIFISWLFFKGGVSYGILNKIPYSGKINIFYIIAPILLLIMNKHGIPASSTFLIISLFVSSENIMFMLNKTIMSYFASLILSFYIWFFIMKKYKKIIYKNEQEEEGGFWLKIQRITTIFLIFSWLCISLSNMSVFLPRKLSFNEMMYFALIVLGSLAIILINKGGKLQEIMDQKKDSKNIRVGTITNLIFSLILFVSKILINAPISTTFVLLAILAGRELATTYANDNLLGKKYKDCFVSVVGDLNKGVLGIIISLIFIKIITFFNFI